MSSFEDREQCCFQRFRESRQRQFGISTGVYLCTKPNGYDGDHFGPLISVESVDDPISIPVPSRTEGADHR